MEKLRECKWEPYKAYFQSERQRREAETTCKAGYNLKSSRKRWGFGWEMLLLPCSLAGEHNVSHRTRLTPASTAFKSTLSTMLFITTFFFRLNFFLITLHLQLSVYTSLHERTPSFCRPERLECGLRRANVKTPPSRLLNTGVNNSAQPEQRLNLRESAGFSGVRCTFFPRPTRRNNDAGTSLCSWLGIFLLYLELSESIFNRQNQRDCRGSSQTLVSLLPDGELQHTSLSPSWWPVGGATWQHIRRRSGRTAETITHCGSIR